MSKAVNMTSGSPIKLIIMFSLPLIIGAVFQQFYSMADALIVGRTLGVDALAAVGCTGSVFYLITGFATGFSSGLSILTAQYFGAKDEEGVKRSFAVCILLTAAITIVITVVSVIFTRQMLQFLQTPENILDDAVIYLRIILLGVGATMIYNLGSCIMLAMGDSKHQVYFLIFACVLNVILDYVFILFFHMGVAGAGIATVFSQLVAGAGCFWYIRKNMPMLWINKSHLKVTKEEIIKHVRVAIPMGFQISLLSIGSLILQGGLNTLSSDATAAYTAADKVEGLVTMPLGAIGSAISTYAAQNYGAGKIQRIKKGVSQCLIALLIYNISAGVLSILAVDPLIILFVGNDAKEVIEMARVYIIIVSISYWILGFLYTYKFTLQGMGYSLIPTLSGFCEMLGRVIGTIALIKVYGFIGITLTNPLSWLVACIPLVFAYYWIIRGETKRFESGLN